MPTHRYTHTHMHTQTHALSHMHTRTHSVTHTGACVLLASLSLSCSWSTCCRSSASRFFSAAICSSSASRCASCRCRCCTITWDRQNPQQMMKMTSPALQTKKDDNVTDFTDSIWQGLHHPHTAYDNRQSLTLQTPDDKVFTILTQQMKADSNVTVFTDGR